MANYCWREKDDFRTTTVCDRHSLALVGTIVGPAVPTDSTRKERMKYLIWSNEHEAWWKPVGHGYTINRGDAGYYDLEQAIDICTNANVHLNDTQRPYECIVPYTLNKERTMIELPDIELVAAAVHTAWMDSKISQCITSRTAEDGEELMVVYQELSEKQKEVDRAIVRTVYDAIRTAGWRER